MEELSVWHSLTYRNFIKVKLWCRPVLHESSETFRLCSDAETLLQVIRWNPISFFLQSCLIFVFVDGGPAAGLCAPVAAQPCSLLLVLRPVGGEQWPEPVPPSLCTRVCWSRCQRIPAVQQRGQDLASIPRPVDNSCQCYCGNVLCYGESLQPMRPFSSGWDELIWIHCKVTFIWF